jgi:3-deoxy-D-manno-octulosonic-acid transferase
VGELVAAIPLIERIHAREFGVLVTTGTVTSAELARSRLPAGIVHQFVPYDAPPFVARFLDHWKPDLGLFVESDLWPNMILANSQRGIPLIVVNGRLSERSFKRWRYMPHTIEALFKRIDLCLVRTTMDAQRFEALGAPRITTTGNLKLDVPALPVDDDKLARFKAMIGNRPVIAAASTHLGEEAAVIDAHRRLKNSFPGLLTIVVPRHPERGSGIVSAATGAGLVAVQRSRERMPEANCDIYVCDTVGELGLIYRLAPIVFMGGSLIRHGGQNPVEAVKLGAAILHGPHISNFAEIYAALDRARGAELVPDASSLSTHLNTWLRNTEERKRVVAAAQITVKALGGALERTISALEPYFSQIKIKRDSTGA